MLNHSTYAMIIVLSLLFIFILTLTDVWGINAMELTTWTIREKPIICINDAKEYKWATIKAVHLWNDFTKDKKWEIKVGTKNCNIKITEHNRLVVNDMEANGAAMCPNSRDCVMEFKTGNERLDNKVRTAAHELGHIISLGHYPYPETAQEALKLGACNSSVMWWVGGCGIPEFPKELLTALECRHTSDGFGGVINFHCQSIKLQ